MKKLYIYGSAFMFICSIFLGINNVIALTTEEARVMLSTGQNPDGTTATQTQLQEANQIYYGVYYNNQSNVTSGTNGSTVTSTTEARCTGDTTTDYLAAQACANLAQTQGRARGLNINCGVNINFLPGINPATGLGYYMDSQCTFDGSTNYASGANRSSAVLLVGYEAGPTTSSNPNTHPSNISPGWSLLSPTITVGNRTTGSGSVTNNTTTSSQSNTAVSSGPAAYASTLTNILNSYIRQANTALQSVTTVPAWTIPTSTGGGVTGGTASTVNNFPRTITIMVNLVNVRAGADTAAAIIGQMTKNQTFVATNVVVGETVHGENRWWLRQNGGYIWAGNTDGGVSASVTTGGTSPGTNFTSFKQFSGNIMSNTWLESCSNTGTEQCLNVSPVSARYIKVQSASRSWIAWREIEIYDAQGNKITPVSVTAQHTWDNSYIFSPSDNVPHGANLAIDGNSNTIWNAGETAPGCNWLLTDRANRDGCGIGNQSAWILIDLGSAKNISKVRLLTENNPNPANATHTVLISAN